MPARAAPSIPSAAIKPKASRRPFPCAETTWYGFDVSDRPKLFISYKSEMAPVVAQVCHCLGRQANLDVYFYRDAAKGGEFPPQLAKAIREHDHFVIFVCQGTNSPPAGLGWGQWREAEQWLVEHPQQDKNALVVLMDGVKELVPGLDKVIGTLAQADVSLSFSDDGWPRLVSHRILTMFGIPLAPFDDLPLNLDARYEKDIIREYAARQGSAKPELVEKGYPPRWPSVLRHAEPFRPAGRGHNADGLHWDWRPNPLDPDIYGAFRSDEAAVLVDARTQVPREHGTELTFPEAGPRKKVIVANRMKVGVLVSGGIAPGINAVISGIVERQHRYATALNRHVDVVGLVEGFRGLRRGLGLHPIPLEEKDVRAAVNQGGSLLPTARADELLDPDPVERAKLLEEVVDRVCHEQISILYVIGGEGSMRAAHAIHTVHKARFPARTFSVIGVPKTMDNDILWVWQSFGFLSAVEKARELIIQLHTEVSSNPRLAVVQLFGSASGYVVSHAAFGSNVCDLALIPELKFSMVKVCEHMEAVLSERRDKNRPPCGMVVMAETAVPTDYRKFMDMDYVGLSEEEKRALQNFEALDRRVIGQTPDHLRRAALKIVSGVLKKYVTDVMGRGDVRALGEEELTGRVRGVEPYWQDYRVLTNEPRHIVRSIPPSVTDVAFGVRLGTMAVDMAMAGYHDCMVSQWLTEYVAVPLKLVVLGRKEVPTDGIFWRTVVSKTGQKSLE